MNAISDLYIKNLIISGYTTALESQEEICARTQVNDAERNEAIMTAANYSVMIDLYGFQKEIGRTYFNVWD